MGLLIVTIKCSLACKLVVLVDLLPHPPPMRVWASALAYGSDPWSRSTRLPPSKASLASAIRQTYCFASVSGKLEAWLLGARHEQKVL